ncbi:MAG TPA: ABC transporter ATP-binding protein [Verrucomicrobiae bacterium]|nr:ABC transporter ATP-binding protein [Verrucomicrobiae bacterium]
MLLQIEKLQVEFPFKNGNLRVVRGVDLSVKQGEIVAVLGESGSGKTVSCTSVLGLAKDVRRYSGRIVYQGKDLLALGETQLQAIRGKEISYVFQDPVGSLNPYLKIGKQIMETRKVHHLECSKELVLKALADVGIDSPEVVYDMYPWQLSGGQCQRIAIAMAVACGPKLLIADEPVSAIDASLQRRILALLQDINQRYGTSIIIITHDFAVARCLGHRVVVMYGGLIVEEGPMEEVVRTPQHPYTIELVKCLKSLASRDEHLYSLEGRAPTPSEYQECCPFADRCSQKKEECITSLPFLRETSGQRSVRCVANCG